MRIGSIDLDRDVLIVAEIGNNHEGNFQAAEDLVRAAAECGAGAVKFQTFRTEQFVGPADPARVRRLKGFELTFDQFERLSRLARSLGMLFISTPLDFSSADYLPGITDALKIASGDNTFYPLIDRLAGTGKPVILSTGLADGDEVDLAVQRFRGALTGGSVADRLAILHCVSAYPVPPEEANLRSIPYLADRFKITVGYSDHTLGIDACVLAVALGARILEKHFTLRKDTSDFRDHALSADPSELRELVRRVRQASRMLGNYGKALQPAEASVLPVARRSIAAARALPQGHQLQAADLIWTRPSGGFRPGEEALLEGRRLKRPIAQGEMIRAADLDLG